MIPIAGSAYTYAYTTMGEIIAWIIGWDLILEYAVSNMSVAVGFSAYFNDMVRLPVWCTFAAVAFRARRHRRTVHWQPIQSAGAADCNAAELDPGSRREGERGRQQRDGHCESGRRAGIRVRRCTCRESKNLHPFMPNGYSGVLTGAAIVFFTYIGFDSVSTAAEETRNPQRNMPIGIIGTLIVCGVLYASTAFVLTGIVNWKTLQ